MSRPTCVRSAIVFGCAVERSRASLIVDRCSRSVICAGDRIAARIVEHGEHGDALWRSSGGQTTTKPTSLGAIPLHIY